MIICFWKSKIAKKKKLKLKSDWSYLVDYSFQKYNLEFNSILLENLERKYLKEKERIENTKIIAPIEEFKQIIIKDFFDLQRGKIIIKNTKEGNYPLISSSIRNKGIIKYIDTFAAENAFTIANNGSVGATFYHNYKFNCTSDVTILIPKKDISETLIKYLCVELFKFKNIYNYNRKLNISRLANEIIIIPYKNDEVDEDVIKKITDNFEILI